MNLTSGARRWLSLLLLLTALLAAAPGQNNVPSPVLESAERKIAYVRENGNLEHPVTTPTVLTTDECNVYLNYGGRLPSGVSNVRFHAHPGMVQGEADVDFDQLTARQTHNNPLLQLFTGRHHVVALAQASADHGVAHVQIQSIEFDGVTIPKFALEYFAAKFLRPKYGAAYSLDSTFHLKNRIDSALPGDERMTIVQR